MNTHVPTDIHKLHFPARLAVIKIFHNVKVLKVTADVIGEIDAMGRVCLSFCSLHEPPYEELIRNLIGFHRLRTVIGAE